MKHLSEIDLQALLKGLSGVRGDILYFNGTSWVRLAKGTSGDVLTQGTNDPQWTSGGGSGAPTNSQYVTLATDATLSNERVLTAGSGISLTDAGAGSTVTAALNINGLTEDASPDRAADFVATYDTSGSVNKKVKLQNLASPAGNILLAALFA